MFSGRLNNLFAKGGRDWIILIFSLLLAFFLWSIQKLSLEYSAYLNYRLVVSANLPGRAGTAVSADVLVVRGKSSGFYILQQRYTSGGDLLKISVDSRSLIQENGDSDRFMLAGNSVRHLVQEALGNDFQLESITTDTVSFLFPKQSYKKVPVAVRSSISYEPQFMPVKALSVKPDSVILYGRTSVLEEIDSIYTDEIRVRNAGSSLQGMVPLSVPDKSIRLSEEAVLYSQEIVRYFENELKVPVIAEQVPEGESVFLQPGEVTLFYRVPMVRQKEEYTSADFRVVVDFREIDRGSGVVRPVLSRFPEQLLQVRMEPHFIECIAY